jgi:predicted nucleic acid-binding protein
MDTVIDTNVIACALLPAEPSSTPAREALGRSGPLVAPDVLRAELVNLLWQWVRVRGVAPDAALAMLDDANALLDEVVPANALWADALRLATAHGHSPYDTLFVALARHRNTVVVSFDRRLKAAFPDDVWTVEEFLSRTNAGRT